jgi:CPA2 family monovalent cation:H+ antiporter-2
VDGHRLLFELFLLLAAGLVVSGILKRLGIPVIAGLLLAGVLIGPGGLRLVRGVEEVDRLSEVGVVLLLFGIGLELSLEKLGRLWRPILLGGTLQMGVTAASGALLAKALGQSLPQAVFAGFAVAISSTAVALRALQTRGEVDAPHGRLSLGILVFQDLAVVPIMLALPLLAGSGVTAARSAGLLFKALALLVLAVLGARILVPRLMAFVARTRERELFTLAVLCVCLGTAWAASSAGVSLPLGAFLGGLVVAGTAFRHQAAAEVIPFREALTAVFFVSVGMSLDLQRLLGDARPVGLLLLALLFGKFVLMVAVGAFLRLPIRVAVLSGAALCQVGEFSFVLMRAARGTLLLDPLFDTRLTAAAVLSMALTPLLLAAAPHLAGVLGRLFPSGRTGQTAGEETGLPEELQGHVVVAGYGLAGRALASALKGCDQPRVVVDLGLDNVRRAEEDGHPALFGDATLPEVLHRLGIRRARELVLLLNDPEATRRAVKAARREAPALFILARAPYVLDVEPLKAAGADEVVTGEAEAAAAVAERVLTRLRVANEEVDGLRRRIEGVDAE